MATDEQREKDLKELNELIERYLNEDPQAVDRLLNYLICSKVYQRKLIPVIHRNIRGSWIEPDDAKQVAYMKIFSALRNRKFKKGGAKDFENWSLRVAKLAIIDLVRPTGKNIGYSDYGMLFHISSKSMKEALQIFCFREDHIFQCMLVLVWRCFKEVYHPFKQSGSRRLQPPDSAELEAIASRYNELRISVRGLPEIKGVNDIQKLLETCIWVIRENSKVRIVSIDADVSESYLIFDEPFIDKFQEENISNKFRLLFANAFKSLSYEQQELLKLSYGLKLTQTDIATVFGYQQYKVARKNQSSNKYLLEVFLAEITKKFVIYVNGKKINDLQKALSGYIEYYCTEGFYEFLQLIFLKEFSDEKNIWLSYSSRNFDSKIIASDLNISEAEVIAKLTLIKQQLHRRFKTELEQTLPIAFSKLKSADERIATLIEKWLKDELYAILSK